MPSLTAFALILLLASAQASLAAPIDAVKPEWRSPYDLYLTPL